MQQQQQIQPKDDSKRDEPASVGGLVISSRECLIWLLHELLRTSAAVALLVNPTTPLSEPETKGVRDAARSLGLQLHVLNASTEGEIDAAFGTLIELRAGALVVSVDPFLNNQRAQIVALAARYAVPAIYGVREFAAAGGEEIADDVVHARPVAGPKSRIRVAHRLERAKPTRQRLTGSDGGSGSASANAIPALPSSARATLRPQKATGRQHHE